MNGIREMLVGICFEYFADQHFACGIDRIAHMEEGPGFGDGIFRADDDELGPGAGRE